MGLKSDRWITNMAKEYRMIEPFVDSQVRKGVISYGVSSYGYDIRVTDEFKVFTNVHSAVVDPKSFDMRSMVDFRGEACIIPPNSFVLARTVEYFRIPRSARKAIGGFPSDGVSEGATPPSENPGLFR